MESICYEIVHIGGPDDGLVSFSPRPYEELRDEKGHVYRSEEPAPDCLEWVSDTVRRITVIYRGIEQRS
jgi:hypothetical protein